MTSTQIRQSFLDFFKSKSHTLVPSSNLLPDSPGLLFTNAGMNQFVPIFLNQKKADVSKWAGVVPSLDTRAADTQKCIRAGGKHNDLEDVGLDTYHHTFFEMLGNWSFGDYFKQEAIDWAWELVVKAWKFPADRMYATVFCPYLGQPGWEDKWRTELEQVVVVAMTGSAFMPPNPGASPFEIADQEAAMYWAKKFTAAGLNPKAHIIPGNKKDNFWMMGETGPCGPCSEIHVDLTPAGDTKGSLVNQGDARCIEIWNLVFIQFNARITRTRREDLGAGNFIEIPIEWAFDPLPAKHVDTGMGFERVTSIMQGTKGLTDFANAKISNYETDIFRPIFDQLEKLSGKKYGSTLPKAGSVGDTEQERTDVAFRVVGDHIRTLSFAIADGIVPGNNEREYVLRKILRRAVYIGRRLGFKKPFLFELPDVLAATMGDVFPEIRARLAFVRETIRSEEESFNKKVDDGREMLDAAIGLDALVQEAADVIAPWIERVVQSETLMREGKLSYVDFHNQLCDQVGQVSRALSKGEFLLNWHRFSAPEDQEMLFEAQRLVHVFAPDKERRATKEAYFEVAEGVSEKLLTAVKKVRAARSVVRGRTAFLLHDTYGYPLNLTEWVARELKLAVDYAGFDSLMSEQKARSRAAQKKTVIELANEEVAMQAPTVFHGFESLDLQCEVVGLDKDVLITSETPFYAEMGGQVGDQGTVSFRGQLSRIVDTKKTTAFVFLHKLATALDVKKGDVVTLSVDRDRRSAIQRHHTVTHLLHWGLHEVVSKEASQKGSFVGPDKLTFDFNSGPLTPAQVADIEKLVNERILENAGVSWTEVAYADVKSRKDVMQFFGDKYGDTVRVVQIGGHAAKLDGYSMELCGGTHTRATGEIGLFRIVGENAIAAGVRRIEAIAGLTAYDVMKLDRELIKTVAGKVNSPIHELGKKIESLLAHQKELEKQVKTAMLRNASNAASELLGSAQTVNGIPLITHNLGDADGEFLQAIADSLKGRFKGVVVLGGCGNNAVTLIATVSPDFTAKVQAGKIIQQIAPIVGGKGGGKPDNARGGGKDASKLDESLAKARSLLGS